jgi:Cu+-exporting ATPase
MSVTAAQAAPEPMRFRVTGMTCQGCARLATQTLLALPGVAAAEVDLASQRATVRWEAGATPDPQAAIEALRREAGFQAEVLEPGRAEPPARPWSPLEGWRFNVVFGSAVTVPLMLGEWVFHLGMEGWFRWLAFALTLPVQAVCGARFYRGALAQLRVRSANMDTLVALGSTTAFAYSAAALFAGWPGHLYFMEAAAIITLISVGHWLEARASERAAGALKALLQLAPPTARWLSAAGVETEVPVANLAVDDRVLLKPGDRVPMDGVVLEGQSAVDEAMLTGESLPVEKAPGSPAYAGTVNLNGRLILRVTATGEGTALRQIIAAVQRAQNSRAQIQRLADRVSNVFVPVVLVVALATAIGWGWRYDAARAAHERLAPRLWHAVVPDTPRAAAAVHAAAVLIVACPCAMGLATPIAILVAANVAARRGILIRDGEALEKSGRLTAVVFDKTGTLTQGKVEVAAIEDLRSAADRGMPLEHLAARLAAPSNHPLSQAVARMAEKRPERRQIASAASPSPASADAATALNPAIEDWQEVRGKGVEASLGGRRLRLGSLAWLRECGVGVSPLPKFADNWADKGATVIGLAADRTLLGLLALRDVVKPAVESVVRQLAAQGRRSYLVTGDTPRTAAAVAQIAGIPPDRVFAEVSPTRKAEIIAALQREGQRVAFVGDGINDAPALKQADLGVAVSRASDVAREAADLLLLRSDIEAIPEALGLAQASLRTIKQNLFWAFFYNAAAMPLAALGFLSPVVCAAAMGLSDLLVIGNALRLRRWQRRP